MKEGKKTFNQFCVDLGILPPLSMSPGRWTRCGTVAQPMRKNASVFMELDGAMGYAQDWASMTECAVWISGIVDDTKRPEFDHAALAKKLSLRRQEETRGRMRAMTLYEKASPNIGLSHPYIQKKRMTLGGLRGARIDHEGWLVVPMRRDGQLISCQRISPEGEKKFVYGAPVKYGILLMHRPAFCVTILCEGVATGSTIYESCPLARVIVCFSAANLIEVAKREQWSGSVAVAADYDRDTFERLGKNPGLEAGIEAAKAIGCGYAAPEFCNGTDWNDAFCEQLERLEAANLDKSFPSTPIALRRGALAPIQSLIMRAAKKV